MRVKIDTGGNVTRGARSAAVAMLVITLSMVVSPWLGGLTRAATTGPTTRTASAITAHMLIHTRASSQCKAGTTRSTRCLPQNVGRNAPATHSVLSLAVGDGNAEFNCEDGSCLQDFACSIRSHEGKITCWGYGGYGLTHPPAGRFKLVVGGDQFACGVRQDGRLACWGRSAHKQMSPPTATFADLNLGVDRSGACGVRSNGALACWGPRAPRVLGGRFSQVSVGTDGSPSTISPR